MKKILLILLIISSRALGAELTNIPSPVAQGGMIHVYVTFQDILANSFSVTTDPGTPELKPLSLWRPGDNFLPTDPWYNDLSPSAEARSFNSQYGFLIDATASDLLPSGTSIGIRLVSSTPGLEANFYRATAPKQFTPVFTTSHDYVLWNGNMWHPVFTASEAGNYEAKFEIFLANASTAATVDYLTSATAMPGYSTAEVTLQFTAVPEPGTWALLALGAVVVLASRRRRL